MLSVMAMDLARGPSGRSSSLRRSILTFVSGLIVLTLLGSTISLFRITEVNHLLDAVNRVSIPMGRLFVQIQADVDVFRREMERSLGPAHWKDAHWQARPIPRWIQDVIDGEVEKLAALINTDSAWASAEEKELWRSWVAALYKNLGELRVDAGRLKTALDQKDETQAQQLYTRWIGNLDEWRRQVAWGAGEYERAARRTFATAERRVSDLRTGLEVVLGVVVSLSLLMLWFGERALRPLAELTRMARQIASRGLRKEDKSLIPEVPLSRNDEVSQLAREFHRMATVLLEREKVVETQKLQLQEQNRALRRMGEFNENILNNIDSVLVVTDLAGRITQCNPVATEWLSTGPDVPQASPRNSVVGTMLLSWPRMKPFVDAGAPLWVQGLEDREGTLRIAPAMVDGRIFGGHVMALRDDAGKPQGAIVVLDDLSQEVELQEKLRRAENLAAIGRMSAQVAHEVRNPLHSIGLEAEMAAEIAAKNGNIALKGSLSSILASVDRLEKITENYLKLSRLSAGEKQEVDLGSVLESVLATYASQCESLGIRVDWRRETSDALNIVGDRDLLEQALGNLFRNSLQALEQSRSDPAAERPEIRCALGAAESGRVWLRFEDNGPGVAEEILPRLFTPFVTTRSQGTGLGLSFVKKVIEDHGGSIEYIRRAGACFEIVLPRVAQRSMPVSPERLLERVGRQAGASLRTASQDSVAEVPLG